MLADYGAAAVAPLAAALERPDAAIRAGAADTLGSVRPKWAEAVTALLGALSDSDRGVRSEVCQSLGQVGSRDQRAVEALAALLKDPDGAIRWAAATALSSCGRRAETVLQEVVAALKEKDPSVLRGGVGPAQPRAEGQFAVPNLIEAGTIRLVTIIGVTQPHSGRSALPRRTPCRHSSKQ